MVTLFNTTLVSNQFLAIIWNYDIFGFNSGRTREYCDYFADNGFLVILPGWFFKQYGMPIPNLYWRLNPIGS